MTKTVVDTSVILSLLKGENDAERLLTRLKSDGGLFINPIIYGELAAQMRDQERLDRFLEETGIKVEALEESAAHLAGRKFSSYLNNRKTGVQCPRCGGRNRFECKECGRSLEKRRKITPDFLIGSHAEEQADRLASFDKGFHRSYFADLEVIPDE